MCDLEEIKSEAKSLGSVIYSLNGKAIQMESLKRLVVSPNDKVRIDISAKLKMRWDSFSDEGLTLSERIYGFPELVYSWIKRGIIVKHYIDGVQAKTYIIRRSGEPGKLFKSRVILNDQVFADQQEAIGKIMELNILEETIVLLGYYPVYELSSRQRVWDTSGSVEEFNLLERRIRKSAKSNFYSFLFLISDSTY
ncbi:MAG: hypothetical protein AAF571_07670 [Verrucomicrobiota bacterium]